VNVTSTSTSINTTTSSSHTPSARGPSACCACIVALSALSSVMLAGCGGGSSSGIDALAAPVAQPQAAVAASVRLEGCVVDAQWMGAAGVAVHVRTADGRAVGTAYTNTRGVFALSVPARSGIVVDTAVDAQGGLALQTGSAALSVAGCLLDGA
jgi:hypothetical protein